MFKKIFMLFIVFAFFVTSLVTGQGTVGVKKGDWIEFEVSTTGTPEEGHDVVWARLEILDVVNNNLSVNVLTKSSNGTFDSDIMILNPQEGNVGVWFIIPPNLDVGDRFYDSNECEYVTIQSSEQKMVAGAVRTITQTTIPERIKSWDKETGVFVGSIDTLENYTLNAHAYKTNLWNPQILGLNPNVFYIALFTALASIIAVTAVAVFYRQRKNKLA